MRSVGGVAHTAPDNGHLNGGHINLELRLTRGVHIRLFSARGRALPLASINLDQPAITAAPLVMIHRHPRNSLGSVAAEVQICARLAAGVFSPAIGASEPILEPVVLNLTARQQREQLARTMVRTKAGPVATETSIPGKWAVHAELSPVELTISNGMVATLVDGATTYGRTLAAPNQAAAKEAADPRRVMRVANETGSEMWHATRVAGDVNGGADDPLPESRIASGEMDEIELSVPRSARGVAIGGATQQVPVRPLKLELEADGIRYRLPPISVSRSGKWVVPAVPISSRGVGVSPPLRGRSAAPLYIRCGVRPLLGSADGVHGFLVTLRSLLDVHNASPEPLAIRLIARLPTMRAANYLSQIPPDLPVASDVPTTSGALPELPLRQQMNESTITHDLGIVLPGKKNIRSTTPYGSAHARPSRSICRYGCDAAARSPVIVRCAL